MNKKQNQKTLKVFLNNMNSWFSNFIIELLRTDYTLEPKLKYEFSGTISSSTSLSSSPRPLPKYFEPNIIKIDYISDYKSPLFQNDIFIYNLNTGDFKEIDYIIKGLRSTRSETEKTVILISNIMTWAKTPLKYKLNKDDDGECYEAPVDEDNEGDDDDNEVKEEEKEEDKCTPRDQPNEDSNSNSNNMNEGNNGNTSLKSILANNNSNKGHSHKSIFFKKQTKTDQYKDKDWFEEKTIQTNAQQDKPILYYTEDEYSQRIPHQNYMQYKYIENQLLSLSSLKENIKAYVVCPGFIYGFGEDFFFDVFKNFFLFDNTITNKHPLLSSLLKAKNTFPTIHIKDLVNLIKRVIERKPSNKYIFAFDHTKNRTTKNIVRAIKACVAKQAPINNNNNNNQQQQTQVQEDEQQQQQQQQQQPELNVDNNQNANEQQQQQQDVKEDKSQQQHQPNVIQYEPIQHFYEMNIDLKLKPSPLFIDEKREDEDKEDYDKRSFKWHCQYGIPENISQIRKEFMKYRGLKANKIFIIGTPYTGKTTLSTILSKNFNLPSLTLNNLIQTVKQTSLNTELLEEIKTKTEELESTLKDAEEAYNKRASKKKTDPPFDINQHMKLPIDLLTKIVYERLNMGDTYLDGFILDGYPRTYEEANLLFQSSDDKERLLPSSVIMFDDIDDEYVINRVKQSEEYVKQYTKEPNAYMDRVNRRLGNVKQLKEQEGYKELIEYFNENEINVLKINCKDNVRDLVKQCMEFIINNNEGKRNVNCFRMGYVPEVYDYESECLRKEKEEEEERRRLEEEERLKKEEEERKDKEETQTQAQAQAQDNNVQQQEEIINEEVGKEDEIEQQQQQKTNVVVVTAEQEQPKVKTREEIEKEREFKLLERKTEVLRRYLSDNVLPLLSVGILRICENRPNDPVEALANFLLENTFESETKIKQPKSKSQSAKSNSTNNDQHRSKHSNNNKLELKSSDDEQHNADDNDITISDNNN